MTIAITDHAIVRWLERKHAITRAEIINEIFNGTPPAQIPNGQFQRGDMLLTVDDNCIVTIKTVAEKKRRAKRKVGARELHGKP